MYGSPTLGPPGGLGWLSLAPRNCRAFWRPWMDFLDAGAADGPRPTGGPGGQSRACISPTLDEGYARRQSAASRKCHSSITSSQAKATLRSCSSMASAARTVTGRRRSPTFHRATRQSQSICVDMAQAQARWRNAPSSDTGLTLRKSCRHFHCPLPS